jgi:hypothetical protein
LITVGETDSDSGETTVKNGQNTPQRVEVIVPNYERCCMWGYSKVSNCGESSHCKLSFLLV